jgi:hypothetical protein
VSCQRRQASMAANNIAFTCAYHGVPPSRGRRPAVKRPDFCRSYGKAAAAPANTILGLKQSRSHWCPNVLMGRHDTLLI